MNDIVLSVQNLKISTRSLNEEHFIIDGVSFDVKFGNVLGIVGESGSGKSITMLGIMGLLSSDGARIVQGEILLEGQKLYSEDFNVFKPSIRGIKMSMIFQEPMSSLNPVITVGAQIASSIEQAKKELNKKQLRQEVVSLLELVGIADPNRRFDQYPHEYSGGMRQRAMIAMAIANKPCLLIADEPTTALDVTIQAQIMEVLREVRAKTGAAMVLVTHDLGLVAENVDHVLVMYGGQIVEKGTVFDVFERPTHPYAISLLKSIPDIERKSRALYAVPGQPPSIYDRPKGCVFHDRCELSGGRLVCRQEKPTQRMVTESHAVACHFYDEAHLWRSSFNKIKPGA